MSHTTIDPKHAKAAMKRLRSAGYEVPTSFRFFKFRPVQNCTEGCGGLILTGAQFRTAERGPTSGRETVMIPGTSASVFIEA